MRTGRTGFLLACLVSVVLAGCSAGTRPGTPVSGESGEGSLEALLAGLLPKPVLPELRVAAGRQSVAGIRTGYAWTIGGRTTQLDEVWPPPSPTGTLVASPGEEVTLEVTFPPGSPKDLTSGGVPAEGSVKVWYEYAAHSLEDSAPVYSGSCQVDEGEDGGDSGTGVRLSWLVPDELAALLGGNSFIVRLEVDWGDPWISFCWNLLVADRKAREDVLSTSRRYFEAAWAGDEKAISALAPQLIVKQAEFRGDSSPVSAHLPGPRNLVFWKSTAQKFKLTSCRAFSVESVHASASGPYAFCVADYEVEVTEVESGKRTRQAVRERIGLQRGDDGSWVVMWASRTPQSKDSPRRVPGVAVRAIGSAVIAKFGPFEGVNWHLGRKWSDDGRLFAFEASVAGTNGIWVAGRDTSELRNILALDGTAVQIVDWAPGQHRVRFIAYGEFSCGPHVDRSGYWLGEVDAGTGEVRDIAFLRYPIVHFPKDVNAPQGRRYLVFRHTPDLWWVDWETGEVTKTAGDVPSWDGLLRLSYSPSGWFAAYGEPSGSDGAGFTVYDIKAAEQRFVAVSGVTTGQEWAHFEGWTPKDEAVILVCPRGEINHGEDASEPAAATALRVYSPTGELLAEVRPPRDDPKTRIGALMWNDDGDALSLAVGHMSEPFTDRLGRQKMRHVAEAMYVWTRSDGKMRKVADVSGEIRALSWMDDDTIEAWFHVPDEPGVTVESGVRIGADGSTVETQRVVEWAQQGDVVVGGLGDWVLTERREGAGAATLIVGAAAEGATIVNDVGPLYLDDVVITTGAFAVSGEVPETYGLGDHWVYLVVRR